jgi:hypothetical protein
MSYGDDPFQQGSQGDPDQWQQNDPSFGQDQSAQPSGGYGLAGQGQMGGSMRRDVEPNPDQDPEQWGQDPNQQMGQGTYQQQGDLQGNQWDPSQQGGQMSQDPYQQQSGQIGQDPYQSGVGQSQPPDQPDQGWMASGTSGGQPDPSQGAPPNMQNQPSNQDDEQRGSRGGIGGMLGGLFGRHRDPNDPEDE